MDKVLFSSNSEEWATPHSFYNSLNREFNFDLDPCCTIENHKCRFYFTKEDDGLKQSWLGYRVFCNPPYGRVISDWVKKAYYEWKLNGTFVVMLLPARTDTLWFHNFIYNIPGIEVRFIKGRLHFNNADRAPFPSMVVIFH